MAGGIEAVAASISVDLVTRLPGQNKKQREGLAVLIATLLDVRSANLMDLSASLPRACERLDMRYQWISRLLGNGLIDIGWVMAPYAREVLRRASDGGRKLLLIVDQTKVNDTHQAVVVAVRVGSRSLPLSWCVKETAGSIGFQDYKTPLETVRDLLPDSARVVLLGDRFYGAPDLIAWCRAQGWDWRLRLKADLLVFEDGGETTLSECFNRGERVLAAIELTSKRVRTNVGMVHEDGHPEPWFVAMSEAPSEAKTLDYGLRWGIEAMFSDLKTRGFDLEDSQLQRTDRIDRLLLVMALAVHWAVSTGMWAAQNAATPSEKKLLRADRRKLRAA